MNPKFDLSFPKFIFGCCKLVVVEHKKNIFKRKLPLVSTFDDIQLSAAILLSNDSDCNCFICITVRHQGRIYYKSNDQLSSMKKIVCMVLQLCQLLRVKKQIQNDNIHVKNDSLSLYSICLSQIGIVKSRKCSVTEAQENVLNSVENLKTERTFHIYLICLINL